MITFYATPGELFTRLSNGETWLVASNTQTLNEPIRCALPNDVVETTLSDVLQSFATAMITTTR